jgi:HEPN domain-containing protein
MVAKKAKSGADHEGEAARMLGFARSDLRAAHDNRENPDLPFRKAAGEALQAAEKALKAVIILADREWEWTHDLEVLAGQTPSDFAVPATQDDLVEMSELVTLTRYPDPDDDIGEDETDNAIAVADAIVSQAIEYFAVHEVNPTAYAPDGRS